MSDPMCYDELKIHADMLEYQNGLLRDWCARLRRDAWIPESTKPTEGEEVIGWVEAHRLVDTEAEADVQIDASVVALVRWEQGIWWTGRYIGEQERVTHWMPKPGRPGHTDRVPAPPSSEGGD